MGTTIVEHNFPFDIFKRGERDSSRHNKRVRQATRKQLKDIISDQDIITGEGNKKVKVRLRGLQQYRFKRYKDFSDYIGRDQFDELEDGEILQRPDSGDGDPREAGNIEGEEVYEVEFTLDELTDLMIEELHLPDLEATAKASIISDTLDFTDRRKEHGVEACLDKRKTILANILRKKKLKLGKETTLPLVRQDRRYKTYDIRPEKHSNAVVFLMMDRSGSMWEEKIYAVKAFYFWIVQFLRRKYEKVEVRFISHDYGARELKEKEFFSISDDGGTLVSAAYELCRNIIRAQYPQATWNIYAFHASDGDTWGDEDRCLDLVEEIVDSGAKLFSYTEVGIHAWRNGDESPLYKQFTEFSSECPQVVCEKIDQLTDIYKVLKAVLRKSVFIV